MQILGSGLSSAMSMGRVYYLLRLCRGVAASLRLSVRRARFE